VRFAGKLGFSIEQETEAAMHSGKEALASVAAERLYHETTGLLCARHAGRAVLGHVDILGVFMPELLAMRGFDQRNPHHIHDVLAHTAVVLDHTRAEAASRWAALLHDMGKPKVFILDKKGVGHFKGHVEAGLGMAEALMDKLVFPNAVREAVRVLVAFHDDEIPANKAGVLRWLGRLGPETFSALLDLKRADNLGQNLEQYSRQGHYDEIESIFSAIMEDGDCYSLAQLEVNGYDMMGLGLSGKAVGEALAQALDAVVSGQAPNEREALLSLMENKPSGGHSGFLE
jgi:tRNA nucleotidyltransferase (CCA-adding enzyme)